MATGTGTAAIRTTRWTARRAATRHGPAWTWRDNQAWLIHEGHVTRGPVGISHGGQGKETPTGTFHVQWKDKDHKSAEFNNAAMPYSVFFADGGIAFHQGNPKNPSAGCVHLAQADAEAWFNDLEVGDEVQVH